MKSLFWINLNVGQSGLFYFSNLGKAVWLLRHCIPSVGYNFKINNDCFTLCCALFLKKMYSDLAFLTDSPGSVGGVFISAAYANICDGSSTTT